MKDLKEILEYQNNSVVYKFMEEYDVSYQESKELFTEMLKWLWLCGKRKNDSEGPLFIAPSMIIIDKMWHTFILFTKSYAEFCDQYFGYFMHHSPTTKSEKDAMQKSMDQDKTTYMNNYMDRYRLQLSYIYDHLGKETVVKWESYGDSFTKEKIHDLIKSPVPQ